MQSGFGHFFGESAWKRKLAIFPLIGYEHISDCVATPYIIALLNAGASSFANLVYTCGPVAYILLLLLVHPVH